MKNIKTIYQGGEGEIVEKKSRFIAHIAPISSEEEGCAFINKIKKQYADARHNCSAFVVGENQEIQRCSDDGEPSQTAGRPMLDILCKEDLHNLVVVVTRYFGGVLLGTGGLVRAYQQAVQEGLKNCKIITKELGNYIHISTDYTGLGKIQYILAQNHVIVTDIRYTEQVEILCVISCIEQEKIKKEIIEITNAKATINIEERVYFATMEGKVLLFDSFQYRK